MKRPRECSRGRATNEARGGRLAEAAARVGEHLLGHVLVDASHADAVAGRAAGCGNPLGQVGWHPDNVLRAMIISQQQI